MEALTIGLLRVAADVRFDWFAFFDGGAELTVHALMARGLRPTVDFGYIYGLLPLAIGEAWYRVAGFTPAAFAVLSIGGGVLTAWGIARTLKALRVGWIGLVWVMVALPIGLISAAQPSLTHVIEPILLVHAIALMTEGRRSWALAIASACIFVKPSMAYLVVASVIVVMIFRDRPRGWRSWGRLLVPSMMVTGILGLGLGVFFGPRVLLDTLVPLTGRVVYRANGFGFIYGSGRAFWLPDRPKWAFYVDTFAGAWLAAVVVLSVSAIVQIFRLRASSPGEPGRVSAGSFPSKPPIELRASNAGEPGRVSAGSFPSKPPIGELPALTRPGSPISSAVSSIGELPALTRPGSPIGSFDDSCRARCGTEIVIVCAILHAAFVGLFFGNQWSWVYYFSILIIGIAATSTRSLAGLWMTAILTVLCLPSSARSLRGPIEAWQGRERSADTFGLWTSSIARDEWRTVLELTSGRKTAILATSDGAATLDPRFMKPVMAFLVRGHFRPQELARKIAQIRESEAVIVANPAPGDPWFDEWPEFAEVLKKSDKLVWSCARMRVYWKTIE